MLLIRAGGTTILNKNDCHAAEDFIPRLRETRVDVLLAQFSGAMWYPAMYGYPLEQERRS